MKRVLIIGGVIAIVIAAASFWFGSSRLDSFVASLIESHGSRIAGTAVRVRSVDISLEDASGTIRGLRVANPEGYASGDAFELDEITLKIDLETLAATPIVLDQLRVAAPTVNFEVNEVGRSNFDVLRSNAGTASSAPTDPAAEGSEPTRIRIRKFEFEQGHINADVSRLKAEEKPLAIDMPALRLNDVGGARGGTPGEIGTTVLSAFTGAVAREVGAVQAQRAVEEKVGGDVGKEAGRILKGIMD
jgi:hypothetical protein